MSSEGSNHTRAHQTCFFGFGFYTRDKASGVITPVECTADGCQSTMLSWFFQWAFCTAGATIVSGAVAERVKSPTYAAFAFLMTSFIYPMVVASTWGGGWLASLFGVGYMDSWLVVSGCLWMFMDVYVVYGVSCWFSEWF